jgi:type II secretory pathway predicted ATPase ExeA
VSHFAGQNLTREPFSSSPDPSFLLGTRQHATCLQELEISLRLRRGLCVVTGDIGTGKTTLCRALLRAFAAEPDADTHLLLDPHFESSEEFLRVILACVSGQAADQELNLWQLKERLKQQLFRLGMVEKRLVVLVIDEGQKISPANLEILREMLNYETNTAKLLQIVIFGQRELEPMLDAMPNLADRINVRRRLTPMSLAETGRMIRHRLRVAAGGAGAPKLDFSLPAVAAVQYYSHGSPRRSVRLCHRAMLEMLVRGGRGVGLPEVLAAARNDGRDREQAPRRRLALAGVAALACVLGGLWLGLGHRGPVLGNAPAAQEQPFRSAPAAQESPAGISSDGVTLLPDRASEPEGTREAAGDGSDTAVSRLTLLPQSDHGPDLRERVDDTRPELVHVSGRQPEAPALGATLSEARPAASPVIRSATYLAQGRVAP